MCQILPDLWWLHSIELVLDIGNKSKNWNKILFLKVNVVSTSTYKLVFMERIGMHRKDKIKFSSSSVI